MRTLGVNLWGLPLLLLLATAGRLSYAQPPGTAAAPQLTRPPRVRVPARPVYPASERAAGVAAAVALQIDIDAAGKVARAVVIEGAGEAFDAAALTAVLAMEFEPAEIDGVPGPIRIRYVQRFVPDVRALLPADGGVAAADAGPASDANGSVAASGPDATSVDRAAEQPLQILARGQAREKGTRDPLVGADVSLSTEDGATVVATSTTDSEGRFELRGRPGGRGRLVVSDGLHEPCIFELKLPIAGEAPVAFDCRSSRSAAGDYESIVRAPSEGREVTRYTLSQPELTSVPGTFGDPLRVVQLLPGVARMPYGLGLLIIRGASPADSRVYVDGHKVTLLYHFLGGPSILTPDLISQVDFYPGGFGARYGRASAGVIDVKTRTDTLPRFHGSADVDFLDSSVYLEGPLGNGWSAAVAGRRSYIDVLLPLIIPERAGSTSFVVAPIYYDYQARVGKQLGGGGRLSLFVFGSRDSLKVIAQDPARGSLDLGTFIGQHRLIATWTQPFGKWISTLSPAYGYESAGFGAGQATAEASGHVFELREEAVRQFGKRFQLVLGLDGEMRFDTINFNIPLPPSRPTYGRAMPTGTALGRRLRNEGLAAYTEVLWDLTESLRLVPGLRFDWFHYNQQDRSSVDPRLIARWKLNEGNAFKAGVGMYSQAPQPQQLDPVFGNPDLPLIWADQYHVGFEHAFSDAITLDTTVYYLRRHNLPISSSRPKGDGRLEIWSPQGLGRAYGLELHLKHQFTRNFFGWISYSLSRSEQINRLPLNLDDPLVSDPTQFDQTHNLILVASRKVGKWEFGTRFRYVTGVPETPLYEGTYDADFNRYDPLTGVAGSQRRTAFHQLDLRAERTWVYDSWQFSAYLDVQNTYNAENPESVVYDFRSRNKAPIRGLPILPVLGFKGRF